jgi:poly-gamma-glutamate synthesis protein (capsule biosynthesis protein)
VKLFLAGDVMTGRGIDQILRHPSDPRLEEPYMTDARAYVELAERVHGEIPRPVDPAYPWGEALDVLRVEAPDVRVVNLETSVTTSDAAWPRKEVRYRMHPANVACLGAAAIDACSLSNNHVMDYGIAGLDETIDTLSAARIVVAGAGRDLEEARAPRRIAGRIVLVSIGDVSSGVPEEWAAREDRAGVDLLPDLSARTAAAIGERIAEIKRAGDVAIVSIHWGSNWGAEVPLEHVAFAHRLVDEGVDVVHGHSSHHARPIEIYRGRLVLYGCGDLIDDYEGIQHGAVDEFRGDLAPMYFVTLRASGELEQLRIVTMREEKLALRRASREDSAWLGQAIERMSVAFGTQCALGHDGSLVLR